MHGQMQAATVKPSIQTRFFQSLYTSTCAGWLHAAIQTPLRHARSAAGAEALRAEPVFVTPRAYTKWLWLHILTPRRVPLCEGIRCGSTCSTHGAGGEAYVRAAQNEPKPVPITFCLYVCSFIEK